MFLPQGKIHGKRCGGQPCHNHLLLHSEFLFQNDPATLNALLSTISPKLKTGKYFSDNDVSDIMAFLSALTDPSSLNKLDVVPDKVPSGLTLAD